MFFHVYEHKNVTKLHIEINVCVCIMQKRIVFTCQSFVLRRQSTVFLLLGTAADANPSHRLYCGKQKEARQNFNTDGLQLYVKSSDSVFEICS